MSKKLSTAQFGPPGNFVKVVWPGLGKPKSVPAVIRRNRATTVEALQQSGVDKYDIPAFLRKQAD